MTRDQQLSFLTPYWSGREMMKIHLASIRSFYPAAPILVSARGGDRHEMEVHRAEFGIQYWLEDCEFIDALFRLLRRCETEYVCIADHDTVLLSNLDHLFAGLVDGRWNLVGVEERIRFSPALQRTALGYPGWLRFAPGQMDATFLMFNWRAFRETWGFSGIHGRRPYGAWEFEDHYGICQHLRRHEYLLPFHTGAYGMGNVLKSGDTPVVWHQWYGAYRTRLASEVTAVHGELIAHAQRGEAAFLADYPRLDFSALTPAWGPGWDLAAEQIAAERAYPGALVRTLANARRWLSYGWRGAAKRARIRIERWQRFSGTQP